jgi:hypothetical protein
MEQQTTNNWPGGFQLSSGTMATNQHMTINPAQLSKDFSSANDDAISSVHPSFRYLPNLDDLQHNFPQATLPDLVLEAQGQDTDMSNMPAFLSYQECLNDPIGMVSQNLSTIRSDRSFS